MPGSFSNSFSSFFSAEQQRSLIRNVYLWMTAGLFLTGIVAHGAASKGLYPIGMSMWGLIIAQLILVSIFAGKIMTMSPTAAILTYATYSILNGFNLSYIFLIYTTENISLAFFIAAGTFAFMSFVGMTTKKDLTSMGTYFIMALFGVILASVINMFLRSSGMYFLISIATVLIFTGLTAYDTQKILRMSRQYGSDISEDKYIKLSLLGALTLYLDFINLFVHMLRLLSFASKD